MKNKFELVKKSCGYSIMSINDPIVEITTQVFVGKLMRKFCTDKVLIPMVSLATQGTKVL